MLQISRIWDRVGEGFARFWGRGGNIGTFILIVLQRIGPKQFPACSFKSLIVSVMIKYKSWTFAEWITYNLITVGAILLIGMPVLL